MGERQVIEGAVQMRQPELTGDSGTLMSGPTACGA
jgi:hypothetical protein